MRHPGHTRVTAEDASSACRCRRAASNSSSNFSAARRWAKSCLALFSSALRRWIESRLSNSAIFRWINSCLARSAASASAVRRWRESCLSSSSSAARRWIESCLSRSASRLRWIISCLSRSCSAARRSIESCLSRSSSRSCCSVARRSLAMYSSQVSPLWKGMSQDRHQLRLHIWQLKMLPSSLAKNAPAA